MLVKVFGYILILLLVAAFVALFLGTLSARDFAVLGIFLFLGYVFFGFGAGGGGGEK